MTKPPKGPVGIKIEGGGNNTFSNIGFHGPGAAFEIGGGSTGNKFNNISVSGGAHAVRYSSGSSPASQSKGGWSRAFEANSPFKKESEQTMPDLADARTKLSRARDHIADVESQINSFLSTDFYRLRFETNQGESRVEVIFDSLHQPQKRVDALIGDAIGNLRSTLDYIAVALAYPHTGKTSGTGFPFADNATGFAGEVRADRCLGPCETVIQDFFINEVQAYQGGEGHALWVVNKLRNIDKHRLLVSTVQVAGVTATWRDKDGNLFTDMTFGVLAGESGTFIDAPVDHIELANQPDVSFQIALVEPPYINGVPVVEFLKSVAGATERLLDAL